MSRAKTPRSPRVRSTSPCLLSALCVFARGSVLVAAARRAGYLAYFAVESLGGCKNEPNSVGSNVQNEANSRQRRQGRDRKVLGLGPNVQNEPDLRDLSAVRRGPTAPNKPNSARQDGRLGRWEGEMYDIASMPCFGKQSQFPPAGTRPGDRGSPLTPVLSRSMAPNKANFRRGKKTGKGLAEKELW
jgi:hypothetical protein